MRTTAELRHLAHRFWWTLRATPPPPDDDAWAVARLPAPLARLWSRQHPLDRRHTVAVARRIEAAAGPDAPAWVHQAALLHDVGKADAPLGVAGRTLATMLELARVRSAPGGLGRYLHYTEGGAASLAAAGASHEVVAWAREHHECPERWTVPVEWGRALVEADRGA